MKKSILILTLIGILTGGIYAQQNWSLKYCVDYAIDNNIELLQKNNDVNTQKVNVFESKASLLPDLNAGTGVDFGFGRNIDEDTYAVTFDQTVSNDLYIRTSVNLFQGLVRVHNISFQKYLYTAAKEEAQYTENKLVFDVISAYYTLYYSQGLADVAQTQVDLAKNQFERMQKLVDVGKESPITVQELKSLWASDKLSLTIAENSVRSKQLELKQLLRLNATDTIKFSTVSLNSLVINPLPSIDSVYSFALAKMPQIKMQEFLLLASKKNLAISKGYISPRLFLEAGYGTKYFDSDALSYSEQLTNKQSQWISVGLTIPIFNNAQTYSGIKRKQIAVKNNELQLEQQKENLFTEITTAIDDLQSAQNEYQASVELREYSKLTLDNMTKKMEKGLASATDYDAAKQRLMSAEAGLLKSKLIFMMRNQMLEFYLSGNWSHL